MERIILFFFFACMILGEAIASSPSFLFHNYNIQDGLSNQDIQSIVRDERGFLWVGTGSGLNRFDGQKFERITIPPLLQEGDNIFSIVKEHEFLFLLTSRGLFALNTQTLKLFDLTEGLFTYNQSPTYSWALEPREHGDVWILGRKALYRYLYSCPKGGLLKGEIVDIPIKPGLEETEIITTVHFGSYDVWIGTNRRVLQCNFDGKVISIKKTYLPSNSSAVNVSKIFHSYDGVLWVGTSRQGLWTIDRVESVLKEFSPNANSSFSLKGETITTLGEDNSGNLVVGTYQNGLGLMPLSQPGRFFSFRYEGENINSLSDDDIRVVYSDSSGVIWVGSLGNGIDRMEPLQHIFSLIDTRREESQWNGPHGVSSIAEDGEGDLWYTSGTSGGGLFKYNPKTKEQSYWGKGPNGEKPFPMKGIWVEKNHLWGLSNRASLVCLEKEKGEFVHHPLIDTLKKSRIPIGTVAQSKNGEYWFSARGILYQAFPQGQGKDVYFEKKVEVGKALHYIFPDTQGWLWLVTYSWGVYRYNPKTNAVVHYAVKDNNPSSLLSNAITTLWEDPGKYLWIGTAKGLCRFDFKTSSFQRFPDLHGIHGQMVHSLVCEDGGRVWIATRNLLHRFGAESNDLTTFKRYPNLRNSKFNAYSCIKSSEGKIYLGTENRGIVAFNPQDLLKKEWKPNVAITRVMVGNQEVSIQEDSPVAIEKDLPYLDSLVLNYTQNVVTISFSVLNGLGEPDLRCSYKLEGLSKEWQQTTIKNQSVVFSNLPPGQYSFLVRVTDLEGVWLKAPVKLALVIEAPWWKSPLAFAGYGVILILIIWSVWFYSMRQVRLTEQLSLERQLREKEKQLTQSKLQFFTNISHEIRTPLTLILGPLSSLKQELDTELNPHRRRMVELMGRNCQRLLGLVDQIMDLRKIDNNILKPHPKSGNLLTFLNELLGLFNEFAIREGVRYQYNIEVLDSTQVFDHEKLEKIIFNLISNAVKYTPSGGSIETSVTYQQSTLLIRVKDTGPGIAKEEQERIFERFYQVGKVRPLTPGTGIGLALTKELVEVLDGTIAIESEVGQGSCFFVKIPLKEIKESEFPTEEETLQIKHQGNLFLGSDDAGDEKRPCDKNKPVILVVEDSDDMRQFLLDSLSIHYNVFLASNGKEGLKVLEKEMPLCIVSDVLMPEMDGLEFCNQVKNDWRTSHIPVILLTARTTLEQQMEGFEIGADAYLAKPFDSSMLSLRISKLIESRDRLRKKYVAGITQKEDKDQKQTIINDPFLQDLEAIVFKYMTNPTFNIEKIYGEMGMSRTAFFKKVKETSGQTAGEYVRGLKLKRAAELLKEGSLRVNEVAFEVGFADTKYFSRVFRAHFGVNPSEFKESIGRGR